MNAGLPGLGLSGLFVLLSALTLPLVHWLRSPRQKARRPKVGPLFALAAGITAAAVVSWMLLAFVVDLTNPSRSHGSTASFGIFGVPVIVVSLGILALLLALPEVLLRVLGTRPTPAVAPVRRHRPSMSAD